MHKNVQTKNVRSRKTYYKRPWLRPEVNFSKKMVEVVEIRVVTSSSAKENDVYG
ncbi:hypothetical protein [Anaplasma phagocytophilum]|uniref:hypothetical protein n=1 Tax=Anaplasma phagocytophilum TaxID=948 RepID=UPI00200EA927|nr:hypothetical protein [Anaplasma phagocytophilum]